MPRGAGGRAGMEGHAEEGAAGGRGTCAGVVPVRGEGDQAASSA